MLPEWASFPKGKLQSFLPYFLYFTKSRKRTAVRRKKDLIGFVQKCIFVCADSRFAKPRKVPKGFNFVSAKLLFGWAESRFAEPRSFPVRETDWYFLRRAKSTAKTRRGLRPSGLPGTIQISARYMAFAEMTGVHQVTSRTEKRSLSGYRRWGFESVRKGGCSANARLRNLEKELFFCKLIVGFNR